MKKLLPFVVVGFLTGCIVTLGGCAHSSPRVVKKDGWAINVPDVAPGQKAKVFVQNKGKQIVEVEGDGKTWTWFGTPEEAVEALLIANIEAQAELSTLRTKPAPKPAKKAKGRK